MSGPTIEISSAPSPEEAAAITAAIELFVAETTPAPTTGPALTGWQRTALIEAVSAKNPPGNPWGEPRGWGALRT